MLGQIDNAINSPFALSSLKNPSNWALLNTAVSTSMLSKMCSHHGHCHWETLTGFKWLGSKALQLEKEDGMYVPFAFEEAIGYMFTDVSYDKDGLAASAVFLSAFTEWQREGLTPHAKLMKLYEEFGFHETMNTYFRTKNPGVTTRLFKDIRDMTVRTKLRDEASRTRDLTRRYNSSLVENMQDLPQASEEMITFWYEDKLDVRLTLRGSGTEPKVKLYLEARQASVESAIQDGIQVIQWVQELVESYLQSGDLSHSGSIRTSSGALLPFPIVQEC